MNPYAIVAAVALITATVGIGLYGLRFARATSDFFLASRSITPFTNASAISGEYLSAAAFLGVAGMVMVHGIDMLWYPVGFTVGFLVLLMLVSAPLRRSGAYTLPDFAESRLESRAVRRIASALVVTIGWLYIIPQLRAAGLTLHVMTGAPEAGGALVLVLVVGLTVVAGGMRSITTVQAFQYWLKLVAIAIPALFITMAWLGHGGPTLAVSRWSEPLADYGGRVYPFYSNLSLVVATFLGTMGLPHVLVRFYALPDGRIARRTSLLVLMLLGAFFIFPPILGGLGRYYTPDLMARGNPDTVVLLLPERAFPGLGGQLLGALVAAGAFASFLAAASGTVLSIAGVLSQDLLQKRLGTVNAFRVGTVIALLVPLIITPLSIPHPLAVMVTMAFAVAASTFCPLLVLGIWWRRLSTTGAIAGLAVGSVGSVGAVTIALFVPGTGLVHALLTQPAAWSAPLAFAVMVIVSLRTQKQVPSHASVTLGRLHTPDKFVV